MLTRDVVTSEEFRWSAREVVRDVGERPHLFVRVTLTGPHFPERALEPFVRVGRTRSRFVLIEEDGLRAHGYFDRRLPEGAPVEYGYGQRVDYRFWPPFDSPTIERLDRTRLPEQIIIPTELAL